MFQSHFSMLARLFELKQPGFQFADLATAGHQLLDEAVALLAQMFNQVIFPAEK